MKRLVFAAGFLAVLFTCQAGSAKTLEEVLKEKGVITEADFKEVTAARPMAYQPGKQMRVQAQRTFRPSPGVAEGRMTRRPTS